MQTFILEDDTATPEWDRTTRQLIGNKLAKCYPGFDWSVEIPPGGGLAKVLCLTLSGKWGFYLDYATAQSASELEARAMRAGGELLERYGIARGFLRPDDLAALPVDFAGNLMPEK